MSKIFEPYQFANGMTAKNRITLAPLTNCQSHDDGSLSSEEINWLRQKAEGGFSIVETAAAYVHPEGKGFAGQLGVHDRSMQKGLNRLSHEISNAHALGIVQLYHGGARAPHAVTNKLPMSPSHYLLEDGTPTREMSLSMIQELKDNFVNAAILAYDSGFNGIEIHAAHAYLIAQFLSPIHNHRVDTYGGSFENRIRLLLEIIKETREKIKEHKIKKEKDKVRNQLHRSKEENEQALPSSSFTSSLPGKEPLWENSKSVSDQTKTLNDFLIGVRISPENHGINTGDMLRLTETLYDLKIDYLSVSFWDVSKKSVEFPDKDLLDFWTSSKSKHTALMVAGRLDSLNLMEQTLNKGADFLAVGRLAIANSGLVRHWREDSTFLPTPPPWSREQLEQSGVSTSYWNYLGRRFPELIAKH